MWDLIVSVQDHCLSFYFETKASKWVKISVFNISRYSSKRLSGLYAWTGRGRVQGCDCILVTTPSWTY